MADSVRKTVCTLSATKPRTSDWKPIHDAAGLEGNFHLVTLLPTPLQALAGAELRGRLQLDGDGAVPGGGRRARDLRRHEHEARHGRHLGSHLQRHPGRPLDNIVLYTGFVCLLFTRPPPGCARRRTSPKLNSIEVWT